MQYIHNRRTPAYLMMLILFTGNVACKKQDNYLNALPDISLTIPKTLNDLQLILQNEIPFNRVDPGLGNVEADEYYLSDAYFLAMGIAGRNEYTWAKDMYPNMSIPDWNDTYNTIYLSNVVLDALPGISNENEQKAQSIKGTALFFRAKAFYNLLQIFALPYDPANETSLPGIVLRLNSSLTDKGQRSSMKDCYARVIADMNEAIELLPIATAVPTQPTKAAAYGYLARICLTMKKYNDAFANADACLELFSTVTNFNNLSVLSRPISTSVLSETIYFSAMQSYSATNGNQRRVDTTLYRMYDANDLRRDAYFYTYAGRLLIYGSFDIIREADFSGITTAEELLIRAECFARQGKPAEAMLDLNAVVKNRYKTGTFIDITASDPTDALKKILLERRKELVFRGLRWTDIRRLNSDPDFAITLTRVINGQTYILPPNDLRYALPIPDNEIQLSGLVQNPR